MVKAVENTASTELARVGETSESERGMTSICLTTESTEDTEIAE
jgi:hypothetical protein